MKHDYATISINQKPQRRAAQAYCACCGIGLGPVPGVPSGVKVEGLCDKFSCKAFYVTKAVN